MSTFTPKKPTAGPVTPLKIDGDMVDTSQQIDKSPKLHRPPSHLKLKDEVGLKFVGSPDGADVEELFINHPAGDWSATMYKGDVALLERSTALGISRSTPQKGYWVILETKK